MGRHFVACLGPSQIVPALLGVIESFSKISGYRVNGLSQRPFH
ncbi:hypothetical protein FQN60_005920 [Etheostoma spectabile]|uniref:Uncharacterized protein n=1 Tax=Etheostoma spectabile TaxID=54343 RepID=A0A5J5CH92_9PERO|nr:hypothetical protein FQN60_005920 [Etheostoma spectabile]